MSLSYRLLIKFITIKFFVNIEQRYLIIIIKNLSYF